MEIQYVIDSKDYGLFKAFQKLQTLQIHRQKTLLRWAVCIMMLMILPIFHLDKHAIAICFVLGACLVWLLISSWFMDRVCIRKQQKQTRTSCKTSATIQLQLTSTAFIVKKQADIHTYAYRDITHIIKFHKILIITLGANEIILLPRHACSNKMEWKTLYVTLMQQSGTLLSQ